MILDVIIGFEPASLLWFILVNGFLFVMCLKAASGCFEMPSGPALAF